MITEADIQNIAHDLGPEVAIRTLPDAALSRAAYHRLFDELRAMIRGVVVGID